MAASPRNLTLLRDLFPSLVILSNVEAVQPQLSTDEGSDSGVRQDCQGSHRERPQRQEGGDRGEGRKRHRGSEGPCEGRRLARVRGGRRARLVRRSDVRRKQAESEMIGSNGRGRCPARGGVRVRAHGRARTGDWLSRGKLASAFECRAATSADRRSGASSSWMREFRV